MEAYPAEHLTPEQQKWLRAAAVYEQLAVAMQVPDQYDPDQYDPDQE